jgi:hypothetical protein
MIQEWKKVTFTSGSWSKRPLKQLSRSSHGFDRNIKEARQQAATETDIARSTPGNASGPSTMKCTIGVRSLYSLHSPTPLEHDAYFFGPEITTARGCKRSDDYSPLPVRGSCSAVHVQVTTRSQHLQRSTRSENLPSKRGNAYHENTHRRAASFSPAGSRLHSRKYRQSFSTQLKIASFQLLLMVVSVTTFQTPDRLKIEESFRPDQTLGAPVARQVLRVQPQVTSFSRKLSYLLGPILLNS